MKRVSEIPILRFSEFDDNYTKLSFGDVYSSLPTGMTPSRAKKEFYTGEIPWITSGELDYNEIFETNENITEDAVKKTNLKIYPRGTLFIAITGLEAPGTRGRCAINAVPATTNQSCMAFQNNDIFKTKFLYYWYLQNGVRLYFKYAQGSKQQSFNAGLVKSFKLSIPSLPEQQKIAAFLTLVDKRIELLEKKNILLETYKKGVLKKIFNQEIRFKDDNGNEFPDWEEKRLGEVCKIQKGKQLNKSELIDTGEYPAINGGINPSGYTDEWNTVADTITISEGGNSCGYVNYIKTNFWCGGHCYSLLEIQNYLQKVYLFEYLKFRESSIMNLRVGSGLPNIQKREIDSFHILIPSINEQKTISSFLSTIGNQIELLETQIDKSKTWKKGLLQKMFV